jgi:4-methylaminobutanoate oxidase (formaldehyde-forming)
VEELVMDRLVDRGVGAHAAGIDASGPLPARAEVVIVGGGIVGASIAYHLAEAGVTDVVLLERNVLGSGTTWHAAGLIAGARGSVTLTDLAHYGRELYSTLQERTGIDVGMRRPGSLSIARTAGRVDELRYAHDVARQCGIDARMVDVDEIAALWPLARTDGMLAGLFFPDDGHVNPGFAGLALAQLAHDRGVTICESVDVTRLLVDRYGDGGGRVVGVETLMGAVRADAVVLACGLWSRELAATAGVHLALYPAEHVHVRSAADLGADLTLPVLRDVDSSCYVRQEGGRLLVGAFEPEGLPRAVDSIDTGGFAEFPSDWEHFAPIRARVEATIPGLAEVGYDRFLNAPESFTPDTAFLLGETAEVERLYVAAGMNSQGIIYAPGVGRELATWIVTGSPGFDASAVDVRRYSPQQANRRYLHARTHESLGRLYAMHWPHHQWTTARDVRRGPLHDQVARLGARFGEIDGAERADWYADTPLDEGADPSTDWEYSYHRPGWFDAVAAEHRAAREAVALFDLSWFATFEVAGPDALEVCQRAATADIDVPVGRAVYTLFLNEAGGIELDGTITRVADERFLVVTPSTTRHRSLWHLRRLARGRAAAVVDVTAGLATIAVMGPRSRDLIERVSPEDWSDAAQPYYTGREVEIADGFAYALRLSYVGELGYELYVEADLARDVYRALWDAGQDLGVRPAGYFALDTLRLEKGYRHLGHDMGPTDDPYSVGLGFAVAKGKTGYVGAEAVAALDPLAPRRRMVHVALDDPQRMLVHDEAVLLDGRHVGRMTSGGYGHTVGRSVGLATLDPGVDLSGSFMVECAGVSVPATVSRRPFYDPDGTRLRGDMP